LLSETFETQFSSYNFHDVTEVVFFIWILKDEMP
jgi:hypothetical protein